MVCYGFRNSTVAKDQRTCQTSQLSPVSVVVATMMFDRVVAPTTEMVIAVMFDRFLDPWQLKSDCE